MMFLFKNLEFAETADRTAALKMWNNCGKCLTEIPAEFLDLLSKLAQHQEEEREKHVCLQFVEVKLTTNLLLRSARANI